MRQMPAVLLAFSTLTAFIGFGSPMHGETAQPELLKIQQRYLDASKALSEIAFQFSTTSVDPKNVETVRSSSKTRVARKGEKAYSEKLRDAPYSEKNPETSHTGMSYDGVESRTLSSSKDGSIFPGYQPEKFRNQDDFLGLQGYPIAGHDILLPSLNTRVSGNIAELLRTTTEPLVSNEQYIIATIPHQRLTFDRSRGLALAKRELYDSDPGIPVETHTFSGFFEVVPSVWIARVINIEGFNNGVIDRKAIVELLDEPTKIVSDDIFVFKFPPATFITDLRTNMRPEDRHPNPDKPVVGYRIPTNPDDLERVVAEAESRTKTFELEERKGMVWRGWLLGVNVAILVIGLIAWMCFRRRS